jgi:hypothetical protein
MFQYLEEVTLPRPPIPLVAIDTETTRFIPARLDPRGKTCHEPMSIPDLIVASIATGENIAVLRPLRLLHQLAKFCTQGAHFVFHNFPFDYNVLNKWAPEAGSLLRKMVDENRIHDTAILEQLINIAHGRMTVDSHVIKMESLATLAKRRCGMKLDKDESIRLNFGQYGDPNSTIPVEALRYAAADAEATYRVFCNQYKEAQLYANPSDCEFPIDPDATKKWGLLSESIQVKGAVALNWLSRFPIRTDLAAVRTLRDRLRAQAAALEDVLVDFGFAKRTKKSLKFSLECKKLRAVLAEYAGVRGITPEFSDTGLLSLTYDFWSGQIPKPTEAEMADPTALVGTEKRLGVWLRYCKIRKTLSTYVDVYATSDSHYPTYYNLGARTGRVSCVRPNLQNIPKRSGGIRGLFIPSHGRCLVEFDYKAAELVALAQVEYRLFGESCLREAINAGLDPHVETAKRLVGDNVWLAAGDKERKRLRQMAKAVNFGLPGGLGAAKFAKYAERSYGVDLSPAQAQELRHSALASDPALSAYLRDRLSPERLGKLAARNLGMPFERLVSELKCWQDEEAGTIHWRLFGKRLRAWSNGEERYRVPTRPGFDRKTDLFKCVTTTLTGRVRGQTTYTAAHNTPFQGLIADACKIALWNLHKTQQTEESEFWSPVTAIHDSILVEVENEEPTIGLVTRKVTEAMLEAIKEVCPDVVGGVDVTVCGARWGANTDIDGKEIKE